MKTAKTRWLVEIFGLDFNAGPISAWETDLSIDEIKRHLAAIGDWFWLDSNPTNENRGDVVRERRVTEVSAV